MKSKTSVSEWLKSKQVQKALKIRACDVMHLRKAGKLAFRKSGNAFLYSSKDVQRINSNST